MLIFIFCFLLLGGWRIKTKYGLILIILFFSILIGFRAEGVGVDTYNYMNIYDSIGRYGYNGYPEPLFGYINLLFYRLGCSFYVFQWFLSLFILGLIGSVIVRYSPNYGYSLFVLYGCFFVFYTMNITRQMLSVSILAYGYHLLFCRKNVKFIICVVLATMCHVSSIFALVVLPILKLNLKPKIVVLSILCTLIGGLVISDSLVMSLAGSYAKYLESEAGFRSGVRIIQAVMLAGWWSLLFLFVYFTTTKQQRDSLWFKIYYTAILVNNILLNTELGLRCTLYFSIAQIIVLPQYLNYSRIKPLVVPAVIVTLFITIFFIIFSYNGSTGVFPYRNIIMEAL